MVLGAYGPPFVVRVCLLDRETLQHLLLTHLHPLCVMGKQLGREREQVLGHYWEMGLPGPPSLNLRPRTLSGHEFVARVLWHETRAGLGLWLGIPHSQNVPSPTQMALPLRASGRQWGRAPLAVPGVELAPPPPGMPAQRRATPQPRPAQADLGNKAEGRTGRAKRREGMMREDGIRGRERGRKEQRD